MKCLEIENPSKIYFPPSAIALVRNAMCVPLSFAKDQKVIFFDSINCSNTQSKSNIAYSIAKSIGKTESISLVLGSQNIRLYRFKKLIRAVSILALTPKIYLACIGRKKFIRARWHYILLYAHCRHSFKGRDVYPYVNTDAPIYQLIIGISAEPQGGIFQFHDDYHHYTLPIKTAIAYSKSHRFSNQIRCDNPSALLSEDRKDIVKVRPFTLDDPKLKVGIVCNSAFTASNDERCMLNDLCRLLPNAEFQIRIHPTSCRKKYLDRLSSVPVELACQTENIDDFAIRQGLVFAGNTAAQLKVLETGTPVVHISGLDPYPFDLYNYVREGCIMGICDLADKSRISQANMFYAGKDYIDNILRVIGGS